MTPVERFDFQRIDAAKVTRTPQGFLRVSGNLTRVGVLPYYRADGSVYHELRHPEDVFNADSLASMVGATATRLHPPGMVNPSNVREHSIGFVGESITHDARFVQGSATIQEATAIADVTAKILCELSPGYVCKLEDGPGEWNGQKYDGRQRDIVYNHLAMGPRDWGRSGPEVALRMDGLSDGAAFARMDSNAFGRFVRASSFAMTNAEAEIARRIDAEPEEFQAMLDGFVHPSASHIEKLSGLLEVPASQLLELLPKIDSVGVPPSPQTLPRGKTEMKKIQIKLDGAAYDVEIHEALVGNLETALSGLQAKADSVEGLEAKVVVAEKVAKDVQVKLDAANDPKALAEAIAARAALVANVAKVAPEMKQDAAASDRDLMVAALVESGYETETFEKRDAAFVDGVFLGAVKAAGDAPANGGTRSGGAAPIVRKDEDDKKEARKYDSAAAHAEMVENNRSGKKDSTWKTLHA